jgi:putative addiction module component (TIGR02574 family)
MSLTLTEIYMAAMDLPAEQRGRLVTLLVDSLPEAPSEEIEAAWAAEIERRVTDLDAGRAKLVSWEEVREEMHRIAAGGGHVDRRQPGQP